jgi:penicillin-binding protein 1A
VDFSSEKPFIQLQNKQSLPLDTTSWSLETPLTKGDVVLVEVKNGKAHLRQIPEVSGAVVVMEARTGQVLALVGGWSHTMSPFNCATQATRQPGSSFKPFVYLAALEQGMSPNDIINDKSITMLLNNGREIYKPKNIDKKTHGFVTVKNSLAYSHNLSSIQLGLDTGIEHIQDIAELFEVYNNASKHPSMILGSKETTLLKLTNAYAMIFNGGYHLKPKFYNAYAQRKISSLNKNSNFCCFERQQSLMTVPISTITSYQRLASPSAIFGLLEMLRAVITHGTGKSLLPIEREFGVKIRGKTGTTNSNRDAWFIGSVSIPGTIYQDDNPLVIGVFVGFLNPKNLGDGKGGALVALPIFGNFIKNIVSDTL